MMGLDSGGGWVRPELTAPERGWLNHVIVSPAEEHDSLNLPSGLLQVWPYVEHFF